MKSDYTLAIIVTGILLGITGGIVWIVRKQNKRIKEGELQNEDILGIMETWDSKSNDVISKLHPKIRTRTADFVNDLKQQGISYRLYSGYRTFDEQAALYGKGRTGTELISAGVDKKYSKPTEKKVTNAKPGTSYHNYGLATDGVQIVNGKAKWFETKQGQPLTGDEKKIVDTAAKYGFYWGGNISSIYDTPHLEDQQYGSVSQLLSLYNNNKIDSNGYLIV